MMASLRFITLVILASISTHSNAQFQFWTELNSGTDVDLYALGVPASDVVYAGGIGGVLRKSVDGGTTWSTVNTGTTQNIFLVYFLDANTGFIGGNERMLKRTVNGGQTWTNVYPNNLPSNFRFREISFVDNNIGYVVGGVSGTSGKVLKTIDGGVTWTTTALNASDVVAGVKFISAEDGFASDYDGNLYRTTSGGDSWVLLQSGISEYLFEIDFDANNAGIVVGDNGTFLRTTNGGNSWSNINSGIGDYITSLQFHNGYSAFAVGGDVNANTATMLSTIDGGITWDVHYPDCNRLYRVAFANPSHGYAVGMNGTILKYQKDGTNSVNDFSYSRNIDVYPNPAVESSTITVPDEFKGGNCSLQLYDSFGKAVRKKQSFSNMVIVERDGLSAGIYNFEVSIDNIVIGTGKLSFQ